jgi:hypothetical protein
MGRFRDKEEAQSKADIILKQAQKEGYTVVDYSYFAKDRSCGFSLYLVPEEDDMSQRQKTNIRDIRNDIWYRYTFAPDLKDREQTCLRFLNAVSDTVSHKEPTRRTANYNENHFITLINGDSMLDKAYQICKAA